MLCCKHSAKALRWDIAADDAFGAIKRTLAKATLLAYPQPECLLALMTDASNTALGAVLQQKVNGAWQPLAFFSKHMIPTPT